MTLLRTLRLALYLWFLGYSWSAAWGEAEEMYSK